MKSIVLILLFFLQFEFVKAQSAINYISTDEQAFVNNKTDNTNLTSFQQLALTDNSPGFDSFYSKHLSELQSKIRNRDSDKRKAEKIFKYLHEEVFLRYELESLVPDLVNANTYNCVTATSLFVSYAEEFEIPFKIYETPAHVYASVLDGDKEIIVELTDADNGFDFDTGIESVLQTLVNSKLISRDELNEKGADQLYAEYVAETIPISKKQLLAIQYHNEALIKNNVKDFESAYNQMNKAVLLYPNDTFSNAYKYIATISQSDFTLQPEQKSELLRSMLNVTKNDSLLTYTMVNYLGEVVEDLLKSEEKQLAVEDLLVEVEGNIFVNEFIKEKLSEYKIYMYTVFAQTASLKGETISARENISKALQLDPENSRLKTYYVSVSSNYALRLSQTGLFETARETIDELEKKYPEGYPVIRQTKVQIILDSLVPLPKSIENKETLTSQLETARQLQPENIYLKSFAAEVFHELAMAQIRRSNYEDAKKMILQGLTFDSGNSLLRSDLSLINDILK